MDEELKRVVEAVLFAAARKLELAEIAKLCKRPEQDVLAVLEQWRSQLDESKSPTMLIREGDTWKLTVREKYISVIKKVVTKTELPKSILETLAVVAYKVPVLQSKVIKIRTNKAYDHLRFLEDAGFITREKSGRTKLLKLTPKFFEYFDLDPSKLKQKFGSASQVEKAIEAKEAEIEQIEADIIKQTEERLEKPQVKLGEGVETYDSVQPVEDMKPTGVEVYQEEVEGLEIYGEKPEEKKEEVPKEEKPTEEKPAEPPKEEVVEETPEEPEVEEKPAEEEEVEEAKEEAPEEPEEKPEAEEEVEEAKEEAPEEPEEKPEAEEEVEEAKEEEPEEPGREPITPRKVVEEAHEKAKGMKPKEFKGKGLFPEGVPPEVEAKIEQRIKQLLTGEEEKPEEKEEEKEE
jgi:segregation and condensation protein B